MRDRALFQAGVCVPRSGAQLAMAAGASFIAYDDVNVSLIPTTATHCSYYGNGPFANGSAMRAHLPHAILSPCLLRPPVANLKAYADWEHGLSIDVEPSLFTPAQAATIAKECKAQGIMPRVYGPLSWTAQIVAALSAVGLRRSDVQLHTAHWTFVPHICSGIQTVWGVISADQTQYTDKAFGRSLDASLCAPGSYGPWGKPQPKPKPKPQASHGQMAARVLIDFDKPAGHHGSIAGLHTGTWKPAANQPLEVFQVSVDRTGLWRIAPVPNTTPPLGGKPNPKPRPSRAAGHNPVPGAVATRVDQGADYTLSAAGGVAPYRCKVVRSVADAPGWKGAWVVCKILAGPFAGWAFYAAEGLKPVVSAGQTVASGRQIVDRAVSQWNGILGNCEWGWAAPDANRPLAQTLPGYSGDQSVQAITCGMAWDRFVVKLGGPAAHNGSGLAPDWSLLPSGLRKALGV